MGHRDLGGGRLGRSPQCNARGRGTKSCDVDGGAPRRPERRVRRPLTRSPTQSDGIEAVKRAVRHSPQTPIPRAPRKSSKMRGVTGRRRGIKDGGARCGPAAQPAEIGWGCVSGLERAMGIEPTTYSLGS